MIKGVVMSVHGERAQVRVNFKESDEKNLRAYIDCWNPIGAHVGDNIIVEYSKVDAKKAKYFIIGFPIGCILAGGIFGYTMGDYFKMAEWTWAFTLGSALIWFAIAMNYIRIFKRDAVTKKEQLTIVKQDPVQFEIDLGDDDKSDKDDVHSFLPYS